MPASKSRLSGSGALVVVDARRPAREHDAACSRAASTSVDADRCTGGSRSRRRHLADAAGDELGVLAAEIEDRDLAGRGRPPVARRDATAGVPSFWARWKTLPSVLMDGAMISSVCCSSRMFMAPTEPMQVRMAPTRLSVPSSVNAGPKRICSSGPAMPDADARAARQVRVRRGHAPVVAAARRLLGAREGGADHDRVGAGGERLADVAAGGHAAVGDDRHVAAGPLVVEVARGRRVRGGGHLRARRGPAPRGSCTPRPGPRRSAARPRRTSISSRQAS